MAAGALEIVTPRLRLRGWRDEDLVPFAELNGDPIVMEHFPAPLTRAESDAFAARVGTLLAERGWGLWAVEVTQLGAFAGFVGLAPVHFDAPFVPAVEIGWRLARAHWNQGFASEAARAVVAVAFDTIGLDALVSFTATTNLPSQRVMQRIGMRHDAAGDFDHPRLPEGHHLRRHVLYRLLATGTIRATQGNHEVMPGPLDPDDGAVLASSLVEPARFALIFERRVEGIYRYLSFRAGECFAEELTAETFARAFAGRRRYDATRGSVAAWLYGIAANLARHHRRDERRRMARLAILDVGEAAVGDGSARVDDRMRLTAALARLDQRRRHVVLLIGLAGLSHEEAASVLHVPVGTVRSTYSRARAQLVELLAERGAER